MENVTTLVVDKTGTLTEGKPKLVAIVRAGEIAENELLRLAASVERASEHPLARAIADAAAERAIALAPVTDFEAPSGKGVTGTVEGRPVALGNAAFLAELGIAAGALASDAERLRHDGATVVLVAIDRRLAGAIAIADPIKATTPEALAALRRLGIRVVMLTGDNRTTAQAVARRLAITEVEAEVLPEQKTAVIDKLRRDGQVVAMAGDGTNDAPALAAADVGIAMGTGTDVAMESAGITLLKGDLNGIVRARTLSRAVMRNIRQNLVLAFVYNALGVPIAAGILYPVFGILLSPVMAAAAMALSSVSVVGNALRLGTTKTAVMAHLTAACAFGAHARHATDAMPSRVALAADRLRIGARSAAACRSDSPAPRCRPPPTGRRAACWSRRPRRSPADRGRGRARSRRARWSPIAGCCRGWR